MSRNRISYNIEDVFVGSPPGETNDAITGVTGNGLNYQIKFSVIEPNKLLRAILKSQFYRPDLEIVINLQEFISKRSFNFRHKGPVDITIDGKRLRNQNKYNTASIYGQGGDSQLLKLINKVENVRIDSSLNGILERRVLKKEIKSINDQIAKLLENTKVEIENDTIFVAEKSQEKALKKFYRIKNKQENQQK